MNGFSIYALDLRQKSTDRRVYEGAGNIGGARDGHWQMSRRNFDEDHIKPIRPY
jgi:hypothetical protein